MKVVERRGRRRYAIQLEVRCRLSGSGTVLRGSTCDISSQGVRFRLERDLDRGDRGVPIELSLTWPVRLQGQYPLQLVMHGFVVRSAAREIAVSITRYEFRLLRVPVVVT